MGDHDGRLRSTESTKLIRKTHYFGRWHPRPSERATGWITDGPLSPPMCLLLQGGPRIDQYPFLSHMPIVTGWIRDCGIPAGKLVTLGDGFRNLQNALQGGLQIDSSPFSSHTRYRVGQRCTSLPMLSHTCYKARDTSPPSAPSHSHVHCWRAGYRLSHTPSPFPSAHRYRVGQRCNSPSAPDWHFDSRIVPYL